MVKVRKRFNKIEEFNPEKIYRTCIRAGADEELAKTIVEKVSGEIYDGITTKEILRMVKYLLRCNHIGVAARYDLKESLMRLGPTGFPFENFVGELLEKYGYKTKLRQIIRGKCVEHEIDVIAELNTDECTKRSIIEVKFRNANDIYIGLKQVLYTYARFLDIVEGYKVGGGEKINDVWLVCNTKASKDAEQYSKCQGLNLITWNYPSKKSLSDMIHEKNFFPITIMSSLDKKTLLKFIDKHIVFVRDLVKIDEKILITDFDLSRRKARNILREAEEIQKINGKIS
ncbi:MAG: ATP cone domain-containing protein [Candidatus Odinarchaeia archaeon]